MDNSVKNNDTSEKEQYVCDLDGKRFDTIVDLEEHKNEHWHNQLWHDKEDPETHGDTSADGLPTAPLNGQT